MNKNKRQSNFEALRIICMIMIVTLHTLGHGGALYNTAINSNNFILTNLMESFSIVAVNCYVLISGFFGINSAFKLKKLFNLYFQTLFYSIAISSLFWILHLEKINLESILRMIFPICMQSWWFISIFLVLYVLTPYINKLLKSLTFKEFNYLLIILTFILVIWPSIIIKLNPIIKFYPIDTNAGYSLYNFIFLYTIGAYINIFYRNKVFKKAIFLSLYISSSLALCAFNVIVSRKISPNLSIYSYNFILIFISSISLFLFFKEINLANNKFINKLASLTLGVYLIHDSIYVRNHIYKALGYNKYYNSGKLIFITILIVLIIYTSCSIIEFFRQCLFNNLTIKNPKLTNFFNNIKLLPKRINFNSINIVSAKDIE